MSEDFKNLVSLDLERIKEIVKDRLKVEPYNTGVCTEYKGTISIFNDRILNLKNNNFYALVPRSYAKDSSGKWLYDMSNFKIYCITKEYVDMNGITVDPADSNKVTSIKLNDKLLVYSSVEGVKEIKNLYDQPLNSRQLACILLKIPKSGTDWLDSLIREANSKDFIN